MSDLSERLVDGLNASYGTHPGHRAAHAKGVLCAATFTPTPAGTVPAVTAIITHPNPASYAALAYHGLHAFGFVATDGTVRYGRFHWIPDRVEAGLDDDVAAAQPPDYLRDELADRLGRGPAV